MEGKGEKSVVMGCYHLHFPERDPRLLRERERKRVLPHLGKSSCRDRESVCASSLRVLVHIERP